MRQGGNAIDAAIATALTLGVVDGHNSGLGGGCFLLVRLKDGRVLGYDGREEAPGRASRDMFLRGGKTDPELSLTGALAVGIPGSLAVYDLVVREYGRLPLADHLRTAARIAGDGFPIDRAYAARLAETAKELGRFPASRSIFLDHDGNPWPEGYVLRQPELARSYRAIAGAGVDWFYRGPFAKATADWMSGHGGVVAEDDFRTYRVRPRNPVRATYRGFEILGFPPPSSGGVHVAQILNLLESFDLGSLGAQSADFIHLAAEAMKLAFADRAHWLGDPDFARVPSGLVAPEYARELARRIDSDRSANVSGHAIPPKAESDWFGKQTTHFSAADAEGNWVACTTTLNTAFGSKVTVPGTGILLNNQMDDFSAQPGVPNYYGLVGSEANAIAPGKRPLSSMSPTLVFKEGQPVMALGAAGGPTIITQVVLALVRVIDFDLTAEAALAQPRFHHQWKPDLLRVERALDPAVRKELERRGHKLEVVDQLGTTQAVVRQGNDLVAVPDPRGEGRGAVW